MQAIDICFHARAQAGLDNAYCPDCKRTFKPKSKEYQEILQRPCLDTSIFSQELELGDFQQDSLEELKPSSTSNGISSAPSYCEKTFQKPPFMETLPVSMQNASTESTCLPLPHHAQLSASQVDNKEVLTTAIASPTPCELLTNANPDGLLLKTSQDFCAAPMNLETNEELISTGSPSSYTDEDIEASGAFLAVINSDCHISANDCLLLPTPTGLSSSNSRPPGQTKLEVNLKQRGLLARGQVANPQFLEAMMGTHLEYSSLSNPVSQSLSPSELHHVAPSIDKEEKPLATALLFPAPKLHLNESSTLIALDEVKSATPTELMDEVEALGIIEEINNLPEQLTYDEERDLAHLERKVERAFYEAGIALEEIRDRKLYRSTHKTFEEYCQDRFGFTRMNASYLIAGAKVVDNLSLTFVNESFTKSSRLILPTKLEQTKALAKLEPDEQRQVWSEAIEKSNGKVPSGAVVKGIVDRIKEKTFIPYTERSEYVVGDVVRIKAGSNSSLRSLDGYWGIIDRISNYAYHLAIAVEKDTALCKGDEMTRVEASEQDKIVFNSMATRIKKLSQRNDLDASAWWNLEGLSRQTFFTPKQIALLEFLEGQYGIE